jgi:general secretion pathway protein M
MSLRDRIDRLEPRERQLLTLLLGLLAAFFLLLVPVGVAALLGSKRSEVQELRDAIDRIQASRDEIAKRDRERAELVERYSKPAPPLAGLLEKLATESKLEIPESQDRAPVPHGKRYEERTTKIVLRKVSMLNLANFMERIEQSGHPVAILRLNIRKRGTEPDSYDVDMIVSAFDRKAEATPETTEGETEDASEEAEP